MHWLVLSCWLLLLVGDQAGNANAHHHLQATEAQVADDDTLDQAHYWLTRYVSGCCIMALPA